MISHTVYEILDTLADKHIPEGRHKQLHVNSRDMWVSIMAALIEKDVVRAKLSILTKCAIHWETLLVYKLSSQN